MAVTNHVFVDYENMKAVSPVLFALERVTSITLFLGPQNHSLELPVVKQLLAETRSIELIQIEKAGKDAVDFTLAYYLGRKAITDPTAFFHIVSKDKGFDPMIEHLRPLHVRVTRHEDYETLFAAMRSKAKTVSPSPTAVSATKVTPPRTAKRK